MTVLWLCILLSAGCDSSQRTNSTVSSITAPVQISNSLVHEDPDENAAPLELNESRTETILGTLLTRATTARSDDVLPIHRYSRQQAWNANETLLDVGDNIVSSNGYSLVRNIPLTRARNWSNINPNLMFGLKKDNEGSKNTLSAYNVSDQSFTTIQKFSNVDDCSFGRGEGSISNDDRYVVLTCSDDDQFYAISYDLHSAQELARIQLKDEFNWAGFSQSGEYILIQNDNANNNSRELIRYDQYLQNPYLITTDVEHGDFGVDSSGDDVFVMLDWQHVFYYRLRDGVRVSLSPKLEDRIGFGHMSCRNIRRPGWCYFSSSNTNYVGAIRIDTPQGVSQTTSDVTGKSALIGKYQIEHWGYDRSTSNHYNTQPKASASPSGTKIIYNSDWYGRAPVSAYVLSNTIQPFWLPATKRRPANSVD